MIGFDLTWLRNTLCYSSVTNYLSQIYFTRNFEAKLMQDYLLNEVDHLGTLLFITEYDSTNFCYFLFNNFEYCIKAIHSDKSVLTCSSNFGGVPSFVLNCTFFNHNI